MQINEIIRPHTLEELIQEAERELAMRGKVYGKWIETSRITRPQAETNYRRQKAIVELLQHLLQSQKPNLFQQD